MHRYRISEIGQKVAAAGFRPLDVLLVGATGVGKSSTLNALFGEQKGRIGTKKDSGSDRFADFQTRLLFGIRKLLSQRNNGCSHQSYPGLSKKDEYAVMIGYRSFERVRPYAV